MSALDDFLERVDYTILEEAIAELAKLRTALEKAIDLAEEGIGYTSSYFREKWHMDEDLAELKKYLSPPRRAYRIGEKMSALDEALTLLATESSASVIEEAFNGYRDRTKLIKKAAAELEYDGKRLANAYTKLGKFHVALDEARKIIENANKANSTAILCGAGSWSDNSPLAASITAWLKKYPPTE